MRTVWNDIVRTLQAIPGLRVRVRSADTQAGTRIVLEWGGDEHDFHLVWLGEGWPSDVRQSISDIPLPWPRGLIAAARELSPGALTLLLELDANWIDTAGHLRLILPPKLFLFREIVPEKVPPRVPSLAWSQSTLEVVEIVLMSSRRSWTIREMALESSWSAPQVSNIFRALPQLGWLKRHGPPHGPAVDWEVSAPGSMLEGWSAHLVEQPRSGWKGHRLMRDPMAFLGEEVSRRLDLDGKWAITGWAGAQLVAPILTMVPSLHLYVEESRLLEGVSKLRELGVRQVEEGANVEVWSLRTVRHHGGTVSRIPVINLPRLYSDLRSLGGRGESAAEHIREVALGY